MTRYEAMLRALAAGDLDSAKAFWRSTQWSDADRAKARRLLATARDLALEVLP